MWISGLQLTLAGITVVFLFLIILVLAIETMSKIVLTYFPEKTIVEKSATLEETAIIAAIVAAVKKHAG